MKIGVLGAGNMGSAIITGLSKKYMPSDICVKGHRVDDKLLRFQEKIGFTILKNEGALDALFVVTPATVTLSALKQLTVQESTIVISAAQGITRESIQAIFPKNPVFCIIPDIPVSVNAGCISFQETKDEDPDSAKIAHEILSELGTVVPVSEHLLGIAGTIGGCGPAFVDIFLDAIVDAGVENGLPRETAQKLAEAMVTGAGTLALESGITPANLKDQVTSPGGSTIKGVVALDANGFRNAVNQAINQANE